MNQVNAQNVVNINSMQDIIDLFHIAYYETRVWKSDTKWFDIPLMKNPMDMMVFQEIICETRPDYIIETGTLYGGSALYMACLLDIIGKGMVITVDNDSTNKVPMHPRIKYLIGDSVDTKIVENIRETIKDGKSILVDLDSFHDASHVLKEMELYSPFVTVGNYLIVEDTNMGGHPIYVYINGEHSKGPYFAVEEFLKNHPEFKIDKEREKYLFTFNPYGYLRRICES